MTVASARLPKRGEPLNDRERQLLAGLSYGKTYTQIGRDLFLSENTMKTHGRRLFAKLGVSDKAHATRVGLEQGYLKPDRVRHEFGPRTEGVERHFASCYTGSGCKCDTVVAS